MKVWCCIGLADTWKTPRYAIIGQWHMAKFGRFLQGEWPIELPDYVSLDKPVAVADNPYPLYVPGEDAGDMTDFFTESEEVEE